MWHLSRAAGGKKRREKILTAGGVIVGTLVEVEGMMRGEEEEDKGSEGMMKGKGGVGGPPHPQAVVPKPLPAPTSSPHLPNIVLHQDLKRYIVES